MTKFVLKPHFYEIKDNLFKLVIKTQFPKENGARFVLLLEHKIPTTKDIYPVVISNNGEEYFIQDIVGNYIMSDQLKYFPKSLSGNIIRMIYGGNPKHFKLLMKLPDSAYLKREE